MNFVGTKEELQTILKAAGLKGDWSEEGDKVVFRSHSGGVLNWWPKSRRKTLHVQGGKGEAEKIERALGVSRAGEAPAQAASAAEDPMRPKVFVVHGHDSSAREQLELVLHRLGLEPFVLQNTSGGGLTIIEALEKQIQSETGPRFGIVLLTPDDWGRSKALEPKDDQPRARQNVVLEMGMLLASLGRPRVAILKKGHLEIPSDTGGILYLGFNDHVKETANKLAERLIEAGFSLKPEQIAQASA